MTRRVVYEILRLLVIAAAVAMLFGWLYIDTVALDRIFSGE